MSGSLHIQMAVFLTVSNRGKHFIFLSISINTTQGICGSSAPYK